MCLFAGEFVYGDAGRADESAAVAMAGRLGGGGLGEAASLLSTDGRCAIGFRRPAALGDGSVLIALDGEIYSLAELGPRLARRGQALGDHYAETLAALWRARGTEMVEELEGAFALAVYDSRAGKLFLARDRLGIKPLWWAALSDRIVFGCQAKPLLVHPAVAAEVDPEAVGFYLTLGYVPAPRSIWRGLAKLSPGHCVEVTSSGPAEPRRYWKLPDETATISPDEAVEKVRSAVTRAVEKRLAGGAATALLSGGIDSSIVTALMCRAVGRGGGIKTFTAGFAEADFDERPAAAAVAAGLGTDHHELLVSSADAARWLDELVAECDEPLADSSVVPMRLLCRAASEHVGVALTGSGGDEVFGGYDRYRAMHLARTMGPTTWAAAKLAAFLVEPVAPHDERSRLRRMVRFAEGLDQVPAMQYLRYRRLFAPSQIADLLETDFADSVRPDQPGQWFCQLYEQGEFDNEPAYAQQHDLLTYLPDDLLVKADLASRASRLRLRCPMLDAEVVALGLSLPVGCKLRRRRGKLVLREAFGQLLPGEVFARGKAGFAAPIDRWLREQLLGTLRQTLLEGALVGHGWMSRPAMEAMIEQHLAAKADHRHRLWALLWLGKWLAAAG